MRIEKNDYNGVRKTEDYNKREKGPFCHGLGQISTFENTDVDIANSQRSEGRRSIFPQWWFPSILCVSVALSEVTLSKFL